MVKLSHKSAQNTSFHNVILTTTPQKLITLLGKPQYYQNTGLEKVNFDWTCETSDGIVFTIYDWKEYKILDLNKAIDFHIGGFSYSDTSQALHELKEYLDK